MDVYATNENRNCVGSARHSKEFESGSSSSNGEIPEEEVKTSSKSFEFLNEAIDKVRGDGSFAIDRTINNANYFSKRSI